MNKSGVGSAGRCAVIPPNWKEETVVSQHTMRIRLRPEPVTENGDNLYLMPEYFMIFFNTTIGLCQYFRWTSGGVTTVHIDFNELRQILIPIPQKKVQEELAQIYWESVGKAHQEAMRSSSWEVRQGWLDVALGMMEVLIFQAEEVLRGRQVGWIPLKTSSQKVEGEYQVLGTYLREADEEGKSWVEKLFGLRLYRFPGRQELMSEFLSQLGALREGSLKEFKPIFSTYLLNEASS
ncbi:MAG: hypothetical protein NZ580_07250 [Bacteroidia bacterium]|nr:hypothetical protein [Bacteroidia bacterium]MDW8236459.1 hypothetical protein [Bacteroidia bacterium]